MYTLQELQCMGLAYLKKLKDDVSAEEDSVCAVSDFHLKDSGFAVLDRCEEERLERCVRVLEKIFEGKTVSDSFLKSALTDAEFSEYRQSYSLAVTHTEHEWEEGRPIELTHYIKLVARADFYNAMADRCGQAKNQKYSNGLSSAVRMRYEAERMYERAREYLRELFENPINVQRIECWLDRDVSWKQGEEPCIDAVSMPRVRGSKSAYAMQSAMPIWGPKRGKLWRQREAVTKSVMPLIYADHLKSSSELLLRVRSKRILFDKIFDRD